MFGLDGEGFCSGMSHQILKGLNELTVQIDGWWIWMGGGSGISYMSHNGARWPLAVKNGLSVKNAKWLGRK